MLICGAKQVSDGGGTLALPIAVQLLRHARPSVAIAVATFSISAASKLAASVMACGKSVLGVRLT